MNQVTRKKKRLIAKKDEILETWVDVRTCISQYVEKLNHVVDRVLKETDSLGFFERYPKVSGHMDKILNIFVKVQCELEIFSCDEILKCDTCNLHCEIKHETPPLITNGSPVAEEHTPDPEDVPVTEDGACEQQQCDSAIEMCTATENVAVKNSTPAVDSVCESEKSITVTLDSVPNDETLPVSATSNDKNAASCCLPSAKRRINHCVIKPNEVLEMFYSHGDSPWNFWLCYYPISDVEFIQESIGRMYYTNSLEALPALPEIGDHVLIADGERFLRGQVLTVRGTETLDNTCVMLLDLDSGRMKSFKLKHIWKIPEELMSIQAQAVNCQLEGIVGDSSIWCKENLRKCSMSHKFEALLIQTTLSVKFIGTTGDSSMLRYIIDADCIHLETDKIYNVSQLVNSTIIPVITYTPRDEVCPQNEEALVSQKSQRTVTSTSAISETKSMVSDNTRHQASDTDDTNASVISKKVLDCSGEYRPTLSPVACKINTDVNSQLVHESDVDCAEILSLCETSYSDVILDGEDIPETNAYENVEQEVVTAIEELPTQNDESDSSLIENIYCSRDIILEKRDYNYLLNQTILGFPSFVNSPSHFYMQFFLDESDEFADLHKKMCSFYSENRIKFSTKEAAQNIIKSYCAGMYPQDRQWYRAEIIDWMPSTETSVFVHFVDFGDKMNIELDSIQPLNKQFATVPVLAQKCHLYGVAPVECAMYSYVSYDWSACSLSVFRNLFESDRLYNMQVMEFTSYGSLGVLLVDPACPETSINKRLITLGQAKYLLNEENLSFWDPMKAEYEKYTQYSYNDEDACEAVTGYSPNDEQRFCKFYARYGSCFKGSSCRKEHVLSHPGGFISDNEEVYQDAFSQIVLPEIGETVYLQVTCVTRINLFYVVFSIDDTTEEETLLTLNRYINDKENLKSLKKLNITPAVGQLVLAHYHQDGIWYRARVIDTDNDSNLVQVFFVDYGNTEWVSEMYVRAIDPQYLHLPFQAIESSLAFAEMNASVDDDSLETVISEFRNLTNCSEPLKAKIISKDNILKKLELQLFDVNEHDIALMLAETGYVNITSMHMTPATGFHLPG